MLKKATCQLRLSELFLILIKGLHEGAELWISRDLLALITQLFYLTFDLRLD